MPSFFSSSISAIDATMISIKQIPDPASKQIEKVSMNFSLAPVLIRRLLKREKTKKIVDTNFSPER